MRSIDTCVTTLTTSRWSQGIFTALRAIGLAVLLLVTGSAIGVAPPVMAANSTCSLASGGTIANCTDVPTDGISYTNGPGTINITNGTATTIVDQDVTGIFLKQSGGNSSGASNVDYSTAITTTVQISGNDTTVLALPAVGGGNPTPITVGADSAYIIVGKDSNNNPTYTVDGSLKTPTELAQLLAATPGAAHPATADLTVNNVNNPATPATAASFSTTNAGGIHVESTGGNGGNGGCVNLLLVSWCDGGDSGGNAASVAVNSDGSITTIGGPGVSATSTGGKGGDGGGTFGVIFSSPGGGGAGGNGAGVTVVLGAGSSINTTGDGAHGVYATSQGGNGGKGGAADAAIALGDDGGHGGSAGAVSVTNQGSITTNGKGAYGIYAASMGAGAGAGSGSGGIVAIGGNGGGESSGSTVTINNSGIIATHGLDSYGIFAESVGGGGGDGGNAGGLFSVGGQAGSGGGADTVTVNDTGSITTDKDGSTGLFAQSVGGGGGNGGNATSVSVGASVAIGGNGGLGGAGGNVIINDVSAYNNLVSDLPPLDITTSGNRANGIQAQSIGGGGGNGGFATSVAVPLEGVSLSFAVGGNGGGGGAAGTVTVNENGIIGTSGNQSIGIFAQSVGGGGGNGGGTVAASVGGIYNLGVAVGGNGGTARDGSTVTVDTLGSIITTGTDSYGIFAQSVGGGGGNGGYAVAGAVGSFSGTLTLGGSGAGGGAGKDVTVTSGGTIVTSGAGATAILAQSVGGGGGNGGLAGSISGGAGGALSISLGGSGGDASTAGTVKVTNNGGIKTTGNNAAGIVAQSTGGGGGNGGMALSMAGAIVSGAASVGGSGGAGSNGGDVFVTNNGTIVTGVAADPANSIAQSGTDSYGIFAQSVGGGGGNGGMAISGAAALSPPDTGIPAVAVAIAVGGKGGGASNGQTVTVNNTGSIETYGLGAAAIYAQSVGGGGGNGGLAGSLALSMGASQSASFGVAVGGPATGGGGDAGEVDVNNGKVDSNGQIILAADPLAKLITNAVGADGIHAQSVGGGGGDGGYALAATFSGSEEGSVSASVAIGGKGGTGGKGGKVDVVNTALIQTLGNQSDGIFAQSGGGGGGDGGMAITGALSFSETAGAVGVTVGGSGGTGSIGGLVTVDNYGQISTAGNDSAGIFAESIGGGGGTGGLALGIQTMAATSGATIGVTVGGSGGDGNNGGEVNVTNHKGATINTTGLAANGITAQSVGGGGGNGGLAANAQLNVAVAGEEAAKTLAVGVTVGGNGGTGGEGGIVNVTNDGDIDVTGLASMGIFAQSVGGGGGNGGNAVTALGMITDSTNEDSRSVAVNVTVGGVGGSGNIGGAVTVDNTGNIVTTKGSGYGIFAESVGGGGGIGGRANTISMVVTDACTLPVFCTAPKSNKNNMSANFSIGGNGGTGGNGGAVKVTNSGDIDTSGNASDGIFAQSIGAGGGNGGNGVLGSGGLLPIPLETAAVPIGSVPFYKNLSVAVGGNGGATGDGKSVEVDNSGSIITRGANSNGVTLESVGGGGGIGGNAAIGITGLVGVGGKGSAGGSGGHVTFTQTATATIETLGVSSDGIFAQSVGGGGGLAGNVDRLLPDGAGPIPSINFGIGLAFGQGGGSGGNGGIVDVTTDGDIITLGDDANGVFAQSVGGGGGVQGTLGNDFPVADLLSWHVGSNGDVGDGGAVNVNVTGNIYTAGNGADGIFAQSAGGKAGTVSSTGDNGLVTTTSAAGTGGNVTVKVDGSVITAALISPPNGTPPDPNRGLGSVGILAQSVGGGGNGNVEVDIGNASDVDPTLKVVQGGRTGVIPGITYFDPLTLDPGTTADQPVTGIGVEILDGKDNTIKNYGTITTADGVNAGYAILATGSNTTGLGLDNSPIQKLVAGLGAVQAGGNDTVNNFGIVTGSFDLGLGTNAFNNNAPARLNMGAIAMVGAGNLLDNAGWMSPGGLGRVMTTVVTGDLTQDSTGTYGTDLDLSKSGLPTGKPGEADLIDVTGTLKMTGNVDLSLLNVGNALPGTHVVTIAHSDTAFASTASDLKLNSPATAVATYNLDSNSNDLMLDYGINFAPAGMTPNETSIGNYINNVQTYLGTNPGGTTDLEPIVAALYNLPDLPSYAAALDQLIPSPYVVNQVTDMMASLQLENSMLSCKVYDGVARFNAEGECGWIQASGRHTETSPTSTVEGYDIASGGFSAGVQRALSENFRVGLAASWDNINGMIGDNAQTTGNRFQLGGVVKAVYGNTTLAATVTGGLSFNDVNRTVDPAGGPTYALTGDQMLGYVAGHARLSQTLEAGGWYVRPMVDVGVTTVAWPDMTEGGGPVAVNVLAGTNTFVTALPAVEIGGEYKVADGVVARPFLRAGALTLLSGSSPSISAGFVAAPDGISPFTVGTDIDNVMLDLVAGVDVISSTNMTLRATASADIGQTTRSYTGNVKFSAPF